MNDGEENLDKFEEEPMEFQEGDLVEVEETGGEWRSVRVLC